MRIPYTQQFSATKTPLPKLTGILRQYAGKRLELRSAIASAFFKDTKDPEGMAGNTLITLKAHGIIDDKGALSQLGQDMINATSPQAALETLTRNMLLNLDCMILIETLREMKQAGAAISLTAIPGELRIRGVDASENSSDLSGVLGWLRAAGLLSDYDVNEDRYCELVGAMAPTIDALKDLSEAQVLFLRSMVALGITEFSPHNTIARHAESLYAGQVSYNWKDLDRTVLQPLKKAGFIELQKAPKSTEGARGGKTAFVKPTAKFDKEVADPILAPIYKAAGFSDIRKIRSIPLPQLLADVKQKKDDGLRGKSLEILAIRICQMLDLDFAGWREIDEALVGGGEVDGFMHTARLIYSRWQIQCKASDKITYEAIAKEVGMAEVTLANVILMVSTGTLTNGAATYRQKIIAKSPLNIVVIDGKALATIVANPEQITTILRSQAELAMHMKPKPDRLTAQLPSSDGTDMSGSENNGNGGSEAPIVDDVASGEPDSESPKPTLFRPYYSTRRGSMYLGDAYDVLQYLVSEGIRVKLLFTSPPFALLRKKAYGNEDQERYVGWFMRFVPLFHRVLEPGGSFVMDIGGSWLPGMPVRSVYQYKLLLRICESDFYLAQEFYHYNPAKLPTPAEWVTVRRLRVKDAMNSVWWFVKEPFVDSDNRRVLREYSTSMKNLLRDGYEAKLRPSGHQISERFNVDRGGSIPPNLLQFSNTDSNGRYLRECKKAGMKPHPARFPIGLPDFFIRFLTKPGDMVLDPFAGSNVTGEAAEALDRQWIGIEISEDYTKGSAFRFEGRRTLLPVTEDELATAADSSTAIDNTRFAAPRKEIQTVIQGQISP